MWPVAESPHPAETSEAGLAVSTKELPGGRVRDDVMAMAAWRPARLAVATVATALTALIIGVPTGIVRTPFYTRMTPVLWWNYPVWAASSLLVGLIAATYLKGPQSGWDGADNPVHGRTGLAGLLSTFAVGCPICNKLVVATLGVSAALHIWAPLQPALGIVSVAMLAAALCFRLAGERRCRIRPARGDAQGQAGGL